MSLSALYICCHSAGILADYDVSFCPMYTNMTDINSVCRTIQRQANVTQESDLSTPLTAVYGFAPDADTLSAHIGQGVVIRCTDERFCTGCSKVTNKHFGGSYCFNCFSSLARCDLCMVSPARCHHHLGTCREPEWAASFCMQEHTVYLAYTSEVKVGLTRAGREQTRWFEQGASVAVPIITAPSRRAAGLVEHYLMQFIADKTDWRKLVSGYAAGGLAGSQVIKKQEDQVNDKSAGHHGDRIRGSTGVHNRGVGAEALLLEAQRMVHRQIPDMSSFAAELRAHRNITGALAELSEQESELIAWHKDARTVYLQHPVQQYSPAVRLTTDKHGPVIKDNLNGIVGQYLLLSQGVFNMRQCQGRVSSIELIERLADADLLPQPAEQTTQGSLF